MPADAVEAAARSILAKCDWNNLGYERQVEESDVVLDLIQEVAPAGMKVVSLHVLPNMLIVRVLPEHGELLDVQIDQEHLDD